MILLRKALRCSLSLVLLLSSCVPARRQLSPREQSAYERILATSIIQLRVDTPERIALANAGFTLLVELNPGDPRGWDGLASVAIRASEYEQARLYLSRALQADPHYDYAMSHLGFLEERAGRPTLAKEWYNRALGLNPLNARARLGLLRLGNSEQSELEARKLRLILGGGQSWPGD